MTPTGRFRRSEPNFQFIRQPLSPEARKQYEDVHAAVAAQFHRGAEVLEGALRRGDEVMRQRILAWEDPCDEMVTDRQVADLVVGECPIDSPEFKRMYDRAAAIWGCSRDEAKRRIYKHCYGG